MVWGGGTTNLNLLDYYIANKSNLVLKEEKHELNANVSVTNKFTIKGKGFFMYCTYAMYSGTSKVEFVVDGVSIKTLSVSHRSKFEIVAIANWAGGDSCWGNDFINMYIPTSDLYLFWNKTLSVQAWNYEYAGRVALYEPIKFNNTLDIIVTYTNTTFNRDVKFNYYLFK